MAGDIKNKYGASQSLTITLASLANNGARESNVIDTSASPVQDILAFFAVKTGASGVSSTGYVELFAYATVDGGTNYTENATGSDAGITLTSPPNAVFVGSFAAVANATTYKSGPFSLAAAFGGVLPEKVGIILRNVTGAALDSTEGNHTKKYQAVYSQYT
jgi:hypothetical protein